MKIKFKINYFIIFIIILLLEILIASYVKDGFIRYTFGDFLATILLFSFFKSFINIKSIYIAIITIFIAFSIEFFQLLNILNYINPNNNKIIAIILGSHFSFHDLVAYTFGVITALIIDKNIT